MATAPSPPVTRTPTLADVLTEAIPPGRVVLVPTPGTATEADAEAILLREKRLCELVDGILVEKIMGAPESGLALLLGHYLLNFVLPRQLGRVLGANGIVRLAPGLVRIPDLAYFSWARLPGGRLPPEALPSIVPDLAVEILSEGNSRAEMEQKLQDYFEVGVRLVWYYNPAHRVVHVYEGVDRVVRLDESATLDGGAVLPGFTLRIADWLAEADRAAPEL